VPSLADDGRKDPVRPNNLYEPVSGDHRAHGDFDDRAHAHSLEVWMATHPKLSAVAVAFGFAGVGLAYLMRGRSSLLNESLSLNGLRERARAA